jgi:hypothetical protein
LLTSKIQKSEEKPFTAAWAAQAKGGVLAMLAANGCAWLRFPTAT